MWGSGQLAFACYQWSPDGTGFRLGALQVLTLHGGRIVEMPGFLDPGTHVRFGLPGELAGEPVSRWEPMSSGSTRGLYPMALP